MKKMIVTLSLMAFTVATYAEITPKWCDSKKLNQTEEVICSDDFLKLSDKLLIEVYANLKSYAGQEGQEGMWPRELKDNQIEWIKERNKLQDNSKIMNMYMDRIKDLYGQLIERFQRGIAIAEAKRAD